MMGCTKPIQVLLACLEKKSEMLALGESSGFVCNLCLTLQQIFFFNYFFFVWLFKDVTSVTCFAASLMRERVKGTLTHLRSLGMLKKIGRKKYKKTHSWNC